MDFVGRIQGCKVGVELTGVFGKWEPPIEGRVIRLLPAAATRGGNELAVERLKG